MRREVAADWGAWLTIAGCALVILLSLVAVAWRVTGHGPIFPLGDDDRVTPATVAPAIEYQEATDGR